LAFEYRVSAHTPRAAGQAYSGDELAMLRLYRECLAEDRQLLLRTARRLAKSAAK
jgi:hypothetical protein